MASLQISGLFRNTRAFLSEHLAAPGPPSEFLLRYATPLIAVRSVAVVVRGVLISDIGAGIVLGLGNFVLQMGVWLAASFTLPVVVKQFGGEVDDRTGFAIMSYASTPLWLVGALYVIPEDPWLTFFWSRSLVTLLAGFGVYVAYRSLEILEIKHRTAVLSATLLIYLVAYAFLFALVGLSSTVFLLLFRPA